MDHNHFIHCLLEGLMRARIKPLNYSQVMAVQQGPLETPTAFLQELKSDPPRKLLFGAYQESPQSIISFNLYPAPGKISNSITPF
jgi:hypothetical protein